MANTQGTRGSSLASYYYQENTDSNSISSAFGFNNSNTGQWSFSVANVAGAFPGTGFQALTIDANTGNIILTPNGSGAVIINGPFIAPGAGFNWNTITGTSALMTVESGYIANNAGLVTLTLPTAAVVGSSIIVTGIGAGGWRIAQNAGQAIHFGTTSTTTGTGGSLSSTATRDSLEIVCVVTNTDWNVINAIGNITVV